MDCKYRRQLDSYKYLHQSQKQSKQARYLFQPNQLDPLSTDYQKRSQYGNYAE